MSGEHTETLHQDQTTPSEGPNPAAEQPAEPQIDIPVEEPDAAAAAPNQGGVGRVAELEKELEEIKAKWLRSVAEEQNIRRRGEKEKTDALKYGITSFAREMVSVADNLGRALASVPADLLGSDFMTGVDMTAKELQNAFNKAGIKRVDALGKPFDHNYHQAVFEINDPDQPAGLVGQVMQEGYVIHDRLLRPAMVGVTKGGPAYVPPAEEEVIPEQDPNAQAGQTFDQET